MDWMTKVAIMIEQDIYDNMHVKEKNKQVEDWSNFEIRDFVDEDLQDLCISLTDEYTAKANVNKYCDDNGSWSVDNDSWLRMFHPLAGYNGRGYLRCMLMGILLNWKPLYERATEYLNLRAENNYSFKSFTKEDFTNISRFLIAKISNTPGFEKVYKKYYEPNQGIQ